MQLQLYNFKIMSTKSSVLIAHMAHSDSFRCTSKTSNLNNGTCPREDNGGCLQDIRDAIKLLLVAAR